VRAPGCTAELEGVTLAAAERHLGHAVGSAGALDRRMIVCDACGDEVYRDEDAGALRCSCTGALS